MSRGRCGSLEDDELLLLELGKRDATQFRQGVFRREREPQLNMHDWLERELACRFNFGFGDQCEINLIIEECFELHSGNHLEEVHVHQRKLLFECADDPRQKQTAERTQKGNGEMSTFPRICGLRQPDRPLGVRKYLLCLCQEVLSGGREFQLLVTAVEQGGPISNSRSRICRLSGGCDTCRCLAAWVMFSASAAAMKYRKWRSSIEPLCLTSHT